MSYRVCRGRDQKKMIQAMRRRPVQNVWVVAVLIFAVLTPNHLNSYIAAASKLSEKFRKASISRWIPAPCGYQQWKKENAELRIMIKLLNSNSVMCCMILQTRCCRSKRIPHDGKGATTYFFLRHEYRHIFDGVIEVTVKSYMDSWWSQES